jgi:hypothetical protein
MIPVQCGLPGLRNGQGPEGGGADYMNVIKRLIAPTETTMRSISLILDDR